jgi:hypothetical protein
VAHATDTAGTTWHTAARAVTDKLSFIGIQLFILSPRHAWQLRNGGLYNPVPAAGCCR